MQKEDQIIGMLEQILSKQDEHSRILGEHSEKLDEHSKKLDEHTRILGEHSQKHDNHSTQFTEHSDILRALRTGQEHLKAEIDGMKISNAREFGTGTLKEENNTVSINLKLLRDEIWANRVDIARIKNTMGMN
ncbi:hypothetical protein CIL05_00250 [Virgibacillus profundi]|uniref:DUF5082 domain-containing protein n=1 Tax=Virgibacillus profundi TaxID=2024555 RepID=A0A2A2III2_9BACI|nr:hypothetical protein [Virgibacillus profundi]PAV31126.1 hypothetical protein CIL05_00250 [Virgibacillus profundi]PXY55309.1 hypothetical protein CIT14_00250 [Virgibacillus profundi]